MQDDIAPSKDTDNTTFFELYALRAAAPFPTLLGPQVRPQGPKPDLISLGTEGLWGEFTLVPDTSTQDGRMPTSFRSNHSYLLREDNNICSLFIKSALSTGRPKTSLLTLQVDLKIKEGIIVYDCCSDSPYHLERPQFHDDLEGGAYAVNGIVSLHSFLCDELKETMASTLLSRTYWGPWKTSTIVLTKSSSSPAFRCFWKEHASSPLAASLGGIGSLVSDPSLDSAGWDFSPSTMYVDPVAKFFLMQLRSYAQELWEAFLTTVHLAATKVVIIFPTHKKLIPAPGIWNSAEAYSKCALSIIQLTYPLTGDKDAALIQFYLSPSTWHTAIAVVNALDIEVIAFSMWHAKQGQFDISGDGICLAAMLLTDVDNAADVQKAIAYVFGHILVCNKAEIAKRRMRVCSITCLQGPSGTLSGGAALHSMNGARLDVLLCEEDTRAEAAAGAGLGEQCHAERDHGLAGKVGKGGYQLSPWELAGHCSPQIMMKSQPPFVSDATGSPDNIYTGSPDNIYVDDSDDLANNPSRLSSCKGTRKPTKGWELEREAYQQAEKGHQDRICSLEQEVIKLQLENSHLTILASFLAESPFIHMGTPTPKPRAKALKQKPKGKGELGASMLMTSPAKTANLVILKAKDPLPQPRYHTVRMACVRTMHGMSFAGQ
ncbi:hypothetical protein BDZ97DRAFT_1757741 [Flammula alnicola]|nr:hypothetical protein BDZ97DRAFT_1757741 [Flammula alnicola]